MNENNFVDDILDSIRRQSEITPEERKKQAYDKFIKPYFIERNAEYPDPEYLIEMGGVPTMPKGNLVAVSAKWKNGKTFFCSILTAVFMGCDHFASCRSLMETGRALFFDTEQSESDTQRVQKTIDAMTPECRHDDYHVACLQSAPIDNEMHDQSSDLCRYDVIERAIEYEHPDLVIIDGIADLIYNYNDVIESQDIVNRLAAMANKHNCCIVVVMHQNKGSNDKNMKGHLGTMLYQKCSDMFSVEKHGNVFEVTHGPSRHRTCGGICFKLDANAVPMDAVADRQLQVELERQRNKAKLHDQISLCFEDRTAAYRRSDIVKAIQEQLGYGNRKSYEMFNDAVRLGVLKASDNRHFCLVDLSKNIDTPSC